MERKKYRNRNGNTNGYYFDYENDGDNNYNFGKLENKMKKKHIEHPVSKFDTLAGIAIKYGVDVADIKKLNGLSTDLQMFALKTLQIPIPGKHPPTPCLSNASQIPGQTNYEQTPPHYVHRELFDSFQSLRLKSTEPKISPAMRSLQGYYALGPADQTRTSEGCEVTVYRKREARSSEDGPSPRPSPSSNLPLDGHCQKSRSLANVIVAENDRVEDNILSAGGTQSQSDKWNEKLVRRRQKSEADFNARTPEKLLEDNSSKGGIPAITGKGLALRPKAASRTPNAEGCRFNSVPMVQRDPILSDRLSSVSKSSSTSNLQDQDTSIMWSTPNWSLKPDLQALSSVHITRPIFDRLSNPITGGKNKAALD